jgi:hypothetical protein
MDKRAKWIALAVLVALGAVLVACSALDAGQGRAVRPLRGGAGRLVRAPAVPSRTVQLGWDEYGVVTYTGLVTGAPPAPPVLRLAVELVQDGRVIYSEVRPTDLTASPVTGTGQYNGDFVFQYPDFHGPAEEWLGCWWEGEGWPTVSCLPRDVEVDDRGYALMGVLESRPEWRVYMPIFRSYYSGSPATSFRVTPLPPRYPARHFE